MSSENNVADRLLTDARKKTAKHEAGLGKVALIVGVIALVASPISIAGWVLGAAAVVLGAISAQRPSTAKLGKIGIGLGVAAILVGVFFFTMNIARM